MQFGPPNFMQSNDLNSPFGALPGLFIARLEKISLCRDSFCRTWYAIHVVAGTYWEGSAADSASDASLSPLNVAGSSVCPALSIMRPHHLTCAAYNRDFELETTRLRSWQMVKKRSRMPISSLSPFACMTKSSFHAKGWSRSTAKQG